MAEKKKRSKLKIAGYIFLILVLLILAFLKWRIAALEAALIRYVSIKTNYEYKLEIGWSFIDFKNVDLKFSDIKLSRTKPQLKKGIRSLYIPHVHIGLRSYKVFFYPDSLEIEKLSIEEPLVEIEKGATVANKHHESLSSHLVKLYPASKEFLEHYRVHELSIKKGGFSLAKADTNIVRVGLIDFYLYEWNVPYINGRSQLQLTLGKQNIQYERSAIGFSEISYSFSEKHIRFSDFSFSTSDTAQRTSIDVAGKEILFDAIDYDQLLDFQRYKVKTINVDKPSIKLKLTLGEGEGKKANHDRVAVTNMLKAAMGEFLVDSVFVKQANVNLLVIRRKDTLNIDLPLVDLELNSFKLLNESSVFYLGGMALSMPNTKIKLFNHLTLSCDQFFIDRNHDISIGDVAIYYKKEDTAFVRCKRIYFDNFDLTQFAFTRELKANAITLHSADISISPKRMKQLVHPTSNGKKSTKAPPISLNHFSMDQVNIFYQDSSQRIDVLGAKCITHSISNLRSDSLQYTLKLLAAEKVVHSSIDQLQRSVITNFRHEDKWLTAGEVVHTDKNFVLKLHEVAVYPVVLNSENSWMKKSDSVKVKDVYLKGMFTPDTAQTTAPSRSLRVNHLEVSSLFTDLKIGKQRLTTHGNDLLVKNFDVQKKSLPFEQLTGELHRVHVSDVSTQCWLDSVQIDLNGVTKVYQPRLSANDLTVEANELELRQLVDRNGSIALEDVLIRNVRVNKPDKVQLNSDSVQLLSAVFAEGKKPVIKKVRLFNNVVHLSKKDSSAQQAFDPEVLFKSSQLGPIEEVYLDKTELFVSEEKSILLNGISAKRKGQYMLATCDAVDLQSPNMFIHMANLSASNDHLKMQLLRVKPDLEAYAKKNRESDILEIKLTNISLMDEKNSQKAGLDILDVGDAKLRVRKDKHLPDAEYSVKPFILDRLLASIRKTGLKEIRVHNGELSYNEISDKTGMEALVELNAIDAILQNLQQPYKARMIGKAKLYNSGEIDFQYQTIDSTVFELNADVKSMDLTLLNHVLMPMESLEITSGRLESLKFNMQGKDENAHGKATVTYKKLRLYIYDKKKSYRKTVKSSLISFIANVFVIRQHKRDATSAYTLDREKDASIFGYWVKGALTGAVKALRFGKKEKK